MTGERMKAPGWPSGSRRFAGAATVFAALATVFVTLVVIWQIHAARILFLKQNPDYADGLFRPTVSRALSDPTVGEPFHIWITLCALLLPPAVMVIGALYLETGRFIADIAPRLSRLFRFAVPATVVAQMVSSFGMWMLSGFRFPDHNAEHMIGSYLFFSAQTLVVVMGTLMCFAIARSGPVATRLAKAPRGLLRPSLCRARALFGLFCVVMTLFYVLLFIAKDMASPIDIHILYELYVRTELVVISGFVVFLSLHLPELWERRLSLVQAGGR